MVVVVVVVVMKFSVYRSTGNTLTMLSAVAVAFTPFTSMVVVGIVVAVAVVGRGVGRRILLLAITVASSRGTATNQATSSSRAGTNQAASQSR